MYLQSTQLSSLQLFLLNYKDNA